jgi:hypothetical protein
VTASANSACPQRLAEVGQQVAVHYAVSDQPLPRARPEWPQEVVQLKASLRNGLRIFESPRKRDQQFSRLSVQPFTQAEAEASGTVVRGSFAMRGLPLDSPSMTQASPAGALTVRGPKGGTMNGNMKTALTVLADALAELPAEDILFTWFRSGRLVGELHELLEQRHPLKLGEMDRVYENQKWAPRARSGRKRQTAA